MRLYSVVDERGTGGGDDDDHKSEKWNARYILAGTIIHTSTMEIEIDVGATLTLTVAMATAAIAGVYKVKRNDEKRARHIRRKRLMIGLDGSQVEDLKKDATAEDSDSESDDDKYETTTGMINPWACESEEGRNWLYIKVHGSSSHQEQLKLERELREIQMRLQKAQA